MQLQASIAKANRSLSHTLKRAPRAWGAGHRPQAHDKFRHFAIGRSISFFVTARSARAIHVIAEGLQPRLCSESEVVEPEEIFEAAQERVVIVRVVIATWPYVLGNYQCSSSTTARPGLAGCYGVGTYWFIAT